MTNQIKLQIDNLVNDINKYKDLYYNQQISKISDKEFDTLYKTLETLELQYPQYKSKDSPTIKVGYTSSNNNTKHRYKMYSLSNVFDDKDMIKFITSSSKTIKENVLLISDLKIDGLALSLTYINGLLTQAITRGDGISGENVLDKVRHIKDIPQALSGNNIPDYINIVGEVYMTFDNLAKLNKLYSDIESKKYSNTRNAASGILRTKVSSNLHSELLNFFAFDINGIDCNSYINTRNILKSIGFKTISMSNICKDINDVRNVIVNTENVKSNLEFPIDGVVFKIDSYRHRELLGYTSHHPKWAIAYKLSTVKEYTTVIDIEYGVGKLGTITPVAVLQPVRINNVLVSKCTLHNFDEIERLDLKIGDTVEIIRSGEVIPKITKVLHDLRSGEELNILLLSNCPSCNSELDIENTNKVNVTCKNPYCKDMILSQLSYVTSKECLNMTHLGYKTLEVLYDNEIINSTIDIFNLDKKTNKLLNIKGFNVLKVNNILKSINNSKHISLTKFIQCLNIEHVGQRLSNILANTMGSLEIFRNVNSYVDVNIPTMGDKKLKMLISYLSSEENQKYINDLSKCVNIKQSVTKDKSPISDLKIAITGSSKNYSREDIKNHITNLNSSYSSKVSKNTNLLLIGNNPGTKLQAAKLLNINIVDIDEFMIKYK